MNLWDIILISLIVVAVLLAVTHCVRTWKRGGSTCGCDCSRCSSPCGKYQKKDTSA